MVELANINVERVVQGLLLIAPYVKIVHHIPGRVRLKFSISGLDTLQEADMENTVGSIPGILDIRVNPYAMSAVIEYEQEQLPYHLWVNVGQLRKNPELAGEITESLRILFGRAGENNTGIVE